MKTTNAFTFMQLGSQAFAHMAMTYPPPIRSPENPNAGDNIDYSITSPLSVSGDDFPCKGSLKFLGTSQAAPVATWQAGQIYNITIAGGANHNGGSCQASLSFDGGKTFTVIHSYIGDCPRAGTSSLEFNLPADTPPADTAVFAWTWFNKVGNREFYMNCAVVTTTSGGAGGSTSNSFSSRPQIFKANIDNGCSTLEGYDVMFPSPGPDVTTAGSRTAAPVGNCGSVVVNDLDTGGGSNGGSGSVPGSSKLADVPVSSTSLDFQSIFPVNITSRLHGGASSIPGGVFITAPASIDAPSASFIQLTTFENVSQPTTTGDDRTSKFKASTDAPVPAMAVVPSVVPSVLTSAQPSAMRSPCAEYSGNAGDGSMTSGVACDPEGQWKCVSGTHFQRCASGRWSVLMCMAPGTKCQSGTSEVLLWQKKKA